MPAPIRVKVTISFDTSATGQVFTVSVDPDPLVLPATFTSGQEIEWFISPASSNWEFLYQGGASVGIDIKGPGTKFKDKKSATGNKEHRWEWLAKETPGAGPKPYKYTISVVNKQIIPATTLIFDPSIHNP